MTSVFKISKHVFKVSFIAAEAKQLLATTQSNHLNLIQYIGIPTAGIHASAWAHSRPQWVFLTITEVHTYCTH